MTSEFAKPVALVTNFVLAAYAMVVGLWMPELAEKVSSELILGVAASINAIYILLQKAGQSDEVSN